MKVYTDPKATERLAADTERKVSRVRSGHTDPAESHALRPLADHPADDGAHPSAKGNSPSTSR